MLEVDSSDLQAKVIRLESEYLKICQHLDGSKDEVAQLQVRCNACWHLEPTKHARDEGYLSQELEWMPMEENHSESAATSNRGEWVLMTPH